MSSRTRTGLGLVASMVMAGVLGCATIPRSPTATTDATSRYGCPSEQITAVLQHTESNAEIWRVSGCGGTARYACSPSPSMSANNRSHRRAMHRGGSEQLCHIEIDTLTGTWLDQQQRLEAERQRAEENMSHGNPRYPGGPALH